MDPIDWIFTGVLSLIIIAILAYGHHYIGRREIL